MKKKATRRMIVHCNAKGQITLPVSVRRELNIGPNTLLEVTIEKGRIVLTPIHLYAANEVA